jgi:hypothetical protein
MTGWKRAGSAEVLAAHAALVPSGHVVYFSGSEYYPAQHNAGGIDHSRLYDCVTGEVRRIESPATDLFCCGHALLRDGRLLVAGGTEAYPIGDAQAHHYRHWPGSRDAWIFDCYAQRWMPISAMHEAPQAEWVERGRGGGRWYPTLVTLADGSVLAMSGHPSHTDRRHTNNTPEIYSPQRDEWTLKGALGVEGFPGVDPPVIPIQYPRLHLLPGGDVLCVTPLDESNRSLRYNPVSEHWSHVGQPFASADYQTTAINWGHNTTSVLLPLRPSQGYRARVLLCGSEQALRLDPDEPSPTWHPTGPRTLPRRYNLNAVLLPTGDVFVCGGVESGSLSDEPPVRKAEVYHPDSDQWETLETAEVTRNYHSVALLLPDGRVWTAGSNHNHEHSEPGKDTRELELEVFRSAATPYPYCAVADLLWADV